jgi:hypothetical protein
MIYPYIIYLLCLASVIARVAFFVQYGDEDKPQNKFNCRPVAIGCGCRLNDFLLLGALLFYWQDIFN